jgi:hypothetical protein
VVQVTVDNWVHRHARSILIQQPTSHLIAYLTLGHGDYVSLDTPTQIERLIGKGVCRVYAVRLTTSVLQRNVKRVFQQIDNKCFCLPRRVLIRTSLLRSHEPVMFTHGETETDPPDLLPVYR